MQRVYTREATRSRRNRGAAGKRRYTVIPVGSEYSCVVCKVASLLELCYRPRRECSMGIPEEITWRRTAPGGSTGQVSR